MSYKAIQNCHNEKKTMMTVNIFFLNIDGKLCKREKKRERKKEKKTFGNLVWYAIL